MTIKDEFKKLSGTYSNRQDTVFGRVVRKPYGEINQNKGGLLDRLFIFFPEKAYEKDISVKIEFISNKRAIVTAYQNGQVFLNKNIRGKFKDNYFYLRPKMFLIPFFPLFYVHNFERIRIGRVSNDIVVDHTIKSWGHFLIVGGSTNGLSTSIYKSEKK